MIRFLLATTVILGFLVFSIPLILGEWLMAKINKKKQQEHSLRVVQAVFRMIFRITGSTLTVKGWENVPEGAVLFVGNHRSYFDIVVGYISVPRLAGFVAKKEMTRYPLLSDWMRLVNCLFLDRKNVKEGLKTILAGVEKVKQGVCIWIFPEGTRNENEGLLDLLPFKEGSLKIAEKGGCPVVPVAFTGTADIIENHLPFMRPSHVTVEFGEPIYLKRLPPEQKKNSGAYTRGRIIQLLEKEQQARRS